MSIGQRVREIRKSKKLSQKAFAEILGVTQPAVQCWEYEKNKPSDAMIEKICRTFSVNPLFLSGESDIMYVQPDEDEEMIDAALADSDPMIKALLLSIVKRPDGWRMLAESVMLAADMLKKSGYKTDTPTDQDKKPGP